MRNSIGIFVALLGILSQWIAAQENLSSRIVRLPLNQNEPSVIKVGTRGVTTIEFPSKIEALDGFGFSVNPAPDGPDLFQISFNKGTNFLSLKAIKEGVEGNLTVVLDGKVYSQLCPAMCRVLLINDLARKSSQTQNKSHDRAACIRYGSAGAFKAAERSFFFGRPPLCLTLSHFESLESLALAFTSCLSEA